MFPSAFFFGDAFTGQEIPKYLTIQIKFCLL